MFCIDLYICFVLFGLVMFLIDLVSLVWFGFLYLNCSVYCNVFLFGL